MKDIAFCGKFSLRYKSYICEHVYMTHDIEIVKWDEDKRGNKHCYVIASWTDGKNPALISCGNRLINELETVEDIDAVKKLVAIGEAILSTENRRLL